MDFLAVQGTLKSLLQHHSSKSSKRSAFFMVQLSHPYMTTGNTIALTRQTLVLCVCISFSFQSSPTCEVSVSILEMRLRLRKGSGMLRIREQLSGQVQVGTQPAGVGTQR